MAFNVVTAVEVCQTHKPTVALSIPFTAAGFHCQMRVMKNSNSTSELQYQSFRFVCNYLSNYKL